MSLVQQEIHTARNRKAGITAKVNRVMSSPNAIVMWNEEAQVLSRTWPACGECRSWPHVSDGDCYCRQATGFLNRAHGIVRKSGG